MTLPHTVKAFNNQQTCAFVRLYSHHDVKNVCIHVHILLGVYVQFQGCHTVLHFDIRRRNTKELELLVWVADRVPS